MLKATDPCDRTLDAHAESCVGNRTERSQIQIPFESVFRKTVFLQPRFKLVALMDPLSATDDFTIALRREDIHAERQRGVRGIFLHVKGLNDLWISMDDQRPVEFLRQNRLLVATEIVPWLNRIAALLKPLHGLLIGDPRERSGDGLELAHIALQDLQHLSAKREN